MQKSRFNQRRSAQGYQNPSERDGCLNCRHRSVKPLSFDGCSKTAYDCRLGGFMVAPVGICREYQRADIARVLTKGQS